MKLIKESGPKTKTEVYYHNFRIAFLLRPYITDAQVL